MILGSLNLFPAVMGTRSTLSTESARRLEIRFDQGFPSEWIGYVRDFYDTIYPEMESLCGPPLRLTTLLIRFDATRPYLYYHRGMNAIIGGRLPSPTSGQKRDIWWDLSFAEVVSQAFYGPLGLFSHWSYGIHRAIANLVMMSLSQKEKLPAEFPNWVYATKTYDAFNYLGGDVVAGMTWGTKASGSPFWSLREGMFLLLAFSFPSKQTGQFDYLARVFKAIKDNVYWHKRIDLSRESYFYVDRSLFDTALDEAAGEQQIDGFSPSEWVRRQAVTLEKGKVGPHLGVYVDDVDNPWRITVFAFDRQFDQKNPSEGFENPLKSLQVWVRVIDWKGDLVYSGNVTTGDDGRVWSRPTWKLSEGGYAVFAEANYRGVRLSCRGYAVNLGRQGSIRGSSSSILGIFLDEEGEPISGSVRTTLGRLEFSRNGIWSIDASGITGTFEALVSSNSAEKLFTKPSAFTRIVLLPARGVGNDLRSFFWGKVIDAETDSPLPGIEVKIYLGQIQKSFTTTDPDGNYRLNVRGEHKYTIAIIYREGSDALNIKYVPCVYVVDTKKSVNNLANFRLHRAATIILDKELDLIDMTRPSSINVTVLDARTGDPLQLNGTLSTYGHAARFIGLDWRHVVVPADTDIKLKLNVTGTYEETKLGLRIPREVDRSFVAEEVFRLKRGQRTTLDMRRLSMSYNLQIVTTLAAKASELIRQAEEYGFYMVSEKKDLAAVNRLSASAHEKIREGKLGEGFSDSKVGYLKASYLLNSISTTFLEAYWSGLALLFFLAFCATALAIFLFDKSAMKIVGIVGVYTGLWVWFYLLFPGRKIIPMHVLLASTMIALLGSASLSVALPAIFGKAKGAVAHLTTIFSLAKRNLRRRKIRTALLTATMTTLVLSFVALTSFSVEYGLEIKAVSGKPPSEGLLVKENPAFDVRFQTLAALPSEIQPWISGREGVVRVIPKLQSMPEVRIILFVGRGYVYNYLGTLSDPITDAKMQLLGAVAIHPTEETSVTRIHELVVAGRLPEEKEAAVMVSVEAARKYGFQVGDQLMLSLVTQRFEARRLTVALVGLLDDAKLRTATDLDGQPFMPVVVRRQIEEGLPVLESVDYCEPTSIVILNVATAQHFQDALAISRIVAIPNRPETISSLAREIAVARDLWVWASQGGKIQSVHLTSYLETRGGFLAIPLALVAVNIGAAIYMAISERKRETNILSTLGVNPADITRMFLGEAIFIALLGAGIGYMSGLSFYKIMSAFVLSAEVRQKVSALWSIAVIGLAVAVSILGAHIPSKQAAVISTPIRLMRWRMDEVFSEVDGWRIALPIKIEAGELDSFAQYMFDRLKELRDMASDHVERLKMIQEDTSRDFNRRLDFTFLLLGKGALGHSFGAGSFFHVRSNLAISGSKAGPLNVELTCKIPKESKEVAYQVADIVRKITLDWSALKKRGHGTNT